jgi:glyoxylase-like metal-dependent hydrolase (beta-lactamase superfamily II)
MSEREGSQREREMSEPWAEVADRVYVRRHRSMDLNVSLVVGEGACLVVDTRASEQQGRDLAEAIRTVTPHPWVVVNTHFHFDHTFGNAALRPATIWGHRRAAEQLITDGERMRAGIAGRHRDAGQHELADDIEASRIDPPDELVDDIATLSVGGRPVQLRHLGRGHTDNDLVLTVPDAGLLIAGDLVEEGAPPQFGSAFPLDWPGTLDAVAELITGPVVPGHGAIVDRAYVTAQRAELANLVRLARAGHAEGRPAADVARELPYFGEFGTDAVEKAYLQLE